MKPKLNKNIVFFIIIGVLAVLEIILFSLYGGLSFSSITAYFYKQNSSVSGMILFEGTNCSHCTTVENFIKNNNVEAKLKFTRLEVFNNPANENILISRAQICGLNSEQIGVPFFWDGEHCIVGYVDIINFFKKEIAQK